MSIRTSFILILILVLAMLAAGVTVAAHSYATKSANEEFVRSAESQLNRIEEVIHTYLKAGERAAATLSALPETLKAAQGRFIANGPPVQEADAALAKRLAAARELIPGAEAAFCGFANGAHIANPATSIPEGYDPRTNAWYSDTALGNGTVSMTNARISQASKGLVVTVASRIRNDAGETMGVAAFDLALAGLTDMLRDIRPGRTGYLMLFDAKGRVILDPKAQENLMRPAAATGDEALVRLVSQPPGVLYVTRGNTEYTAFTRIMGDTGWKAALLMERAEQSAPGKETFLLLALICGAAALLFAGIGSFLAVVITRPLRALIRQSGALADGNMEALEGIPGRGPDITTLHGNLGRLAGRFILLAKAERAKSETAHAKSLEASEALSKAALAGKAVAEARADTSRKTAEAIRPLAAEIAKTVTNALGQNDIATQKTAAVVRDAAIEFKAAADTAQDAIDIAYQVLETETNTRTLERAVQSAAAATEDLVQAVSSTNTLAAHLLPGLAPLKNTSGDVTAAAAAVRELADKINMIGLNLSIEATGIGDNAAPFNAIANDMRGLVEKVMSLAAAMDSIVSHFDQTHTAHALTANKNAASAQRAASLAAKAASAFTGATAKATATAEQIGVLSTALAGLADAGKNSSLEAEALLRAANGAANALSEFSGSLTGLTTLSANLAAIVEELEADPQRA